VPDFRFRTVSADGHLVSESTRSASTMTEAVLIGRRIASETRGCRPQDCEGWLVDIIDSRGYWVISVDLDEIRSS
jgi:hypothetical protein